MPPPGIGSATRAGAVARDLRHLALYIGKRMVAMLLTVLVGVYLTIVIANMGGRVDDLRRLQEQQDVMVAELQHRTRNLITVVRSLAESR